MSKNNVLLGSVLGSILGSVSAALIPGEKQKSKDNSWATKAMQMSENLYNELSITDPATKHFIAGALVGLLIGAGSTALLSPTLGKKIRKGVSNKYHDVADKTQEVIELISEYASSAKPTVKKAVRKARGAVESLNETAKKATRKTSKSLSLNGKKKPARGKSRKSLAS